MIDFFLSTLSFGCPLWLALGGFFSTWRLLPPTPNIFSVPTTCASLGYTFVGFPAAFTSYSNSSIPAEATVYFSVLEHAFAASPVIFLYDALYLSLFVHGTPKHGSGPERCSGIFVVTSFDHLLCKYLSGISWMSRLVKTFRILGQRRPSLSNMVALARIWSWILTNWNVTYSARIWVSYLNCQTMIIFSNITHPEFFWIT